MPHGITLLTSPRNNDSCYLLFEQPSSDHFHAAPGASSYLWFPSHDLLALTKSTHSHFSSRLKGTNASSSSSSYLYSWCSPHNSRFVTKSPVWNSHHECRKLSYSSFWTLKIFIAEMEFLLRIALIQIAHLPNAASTRPRVPYCSPQQNGLATLLALLLIAVRDPLLTTSSPLPGLLLTRLSLRFHHLLVLSKSACYSRWSNAKSCDSSLWCTSHDFLASTKSSPSSHLKQSSNSITKLAGHQLLPYKPNHFCTSY